MVQIYQGSTASLLLPLSLGLVGQPKLRSAAISVRLSSWANSSCLGAESFGLEDEEIKDEEIN